MTPQINRRLQSIRARLNEEDAAGYGPDLTNLKPTNLSKSEPGEGGATNETDIPDALDKYLGGIADHLVQNYGMSEDEAFAKIGTVARSLSSEGTLTSFPTQNSDDADIAVWLGKAASVGFAQHVFKAANDA